MANVYFAVFDRQEMPSAITNKGLKAGKEGKIIGAAEYSAKWVELEAESVADAQTTIKALYGGTTDVPVIVATAAWKES